jgi:signal transduction histidine kinase
MLERATNIDFAQMGHELRTVVNHILGYTGMLIEDAKELGLSEMVPALQEIHRGGWKVLERIDVGLAGAEHDTKGDRLAALEKSLHGPTQDLLGKSEALSAQFRGGGHTQLAAETDSTADAVRRLISLVSEFRNQLATPCTTSSNLSVPLAR